MSRWEGPGGIVVEVIELELTGKAEWAGQRTYPARPGRQYQVTWHGFHYGAWSDDQLAQVLEPELMDHLRHVTRQETGR